MRFMMTGTLAMFGTSALFLCGCNGPNRCDDPDDPSPLTLNWTSDSSSYHVGDDAGYWVRADNATAGLDWSVEGLPFEWTKNTSAESCRITGAMMIGATAPRTIRVTAVESGTGRTATLDLEVVADRYQRQVEARFEQECGIAGNQTLCYTVQLPQRFKRDPDRSGSWRAWIDTAGLTPGDELSVFDFGPTEFESSRKPIPAEVGETKAGEADSGETTDRQGSRVALEAIEDGLIRVRIKAPAEQNYSIAKVEIRID